jgi:signal transduction histidine kinase
MRIRSIQVKIVSVIIVVLIISTALSISFTITNQKQNLLEAAQQTLSVNTQVLNHTIRNIMLSGEAPLANQTMGDLRNMPEFLEYEIYRRDGTTAFSNYETLEFVNSYQDRVQFSPTPRLEGEMIDKPGFKEVLSFKTPVVILDEASEEMEYFFPILNHADCQACHGEDHFIRGISHFRISLSDIYQKVGSARTMLTLFFSAVGLFLFVGIIILLRRIIINPVKAIGKVVSLVGAGNLSIQIDMKKQDELGQLSDRINRMITGLKESKLLELENTRIEARLEESRKYLDNIREGLLLLNPDHTITEEYSFYLKELFERERISGLTLTDFIYGEGEATVEKREEMEMFLTFLFTNKTASLNMIMELNPIQNMRLQLSGGREIIINADFQRIYKDDEVENVMVLFEDMTDIIRTQEELEAERESRESELEQIAAILKLGPRVFEEFISDADKTIDFINSSRDLLHDSENLNRAFRETHSLKGTAKYLKFNSFESTAHKLETHFANLRSGGATVREDLSPEAEALLRELEAETESVKKILDRFRTFAVSSPSGSSELDIFSERLGEMVEDLAGELDKKVDLIFSSDLKNIPSFNKLQPSIFHLVRNGIDHGIEGPFDRLALRKKETAVLKVSLTKDDAALRIEIEDDGAGLDFEAIEKKAVEMELLKPGKHFPSQILNAMFKPGFSSHSEATNVSGRGVGLDAVKNDIKALGGQISVRTRKGRGTVFILTIPLARLEA